MSAGQSIWPCGEAQLVCRQEHVSVRQLWHQLVTGSGLLWAAVSTSAKIEHNSHVTKLWRHWTMYRSATSLLLWSLNEQTAIFASKNNSLISATCNRTCWTTWRKLRGVGRKKNRLSKTATGAMARYFDIALLPPHLETKEDPHPQQKTKKTTEPTEGRSRA